MEVMHLTSLRSLTGYPSYETPIRRAPLAGARFLSLYESYQENKPTSFPKS